MAESCSTIYDPDFFWKGHLPSATLFSFPLLYSTIQWNSTNLCWTLNQKKMLDALSQSLRGDELQSLLVCSDDDLTAQKIVSPLFQSRQNRAFFIQRLSRGLKTQCFAEISYFQPCINTTPMPVLHASVSSIKGAEKLGKVRTGAVTKTCLWCSKAKVYSCNQ